MEAGDMGVKVGDVGVGVRVGDRDSLPNSGFFDLDLRRFLRRINASVVVTTEENLLQRIAVFASNRCAAASV